MQIWTTFCPQKLIWEITSLKTKGRNPQSNWLKEQNIVDESLALLRQNGIDGVRLAVFPDDFVVAEDRFDFKSVDKVLGLIAKNTLEADLCVGPYQYPHYPGVFLPKVYRGIFADRDIVDNNTRVKKYGEDLLNSFLERYDSDSRVRSFYLGNEWPDMQNLNLDQKIKVGVSYDFKMNSSKLCKTKTSKIINFNTNIDPCFERCSETYIDFLKVLGDQGRIGLDVYPSQETWKKTPGIKSLRLIKSYKDSVEDLKIKFGKDRVFFAEVEAQPWGGGQSWYKIISESVDPENIYGYTPSFFREVLERYVMPTGIEEASFWGSEFWIVAEHMKIKWPLRLLKELH